MTRIIGTLREDIRIVMRTSHRILLRRNVADKVCRENQNMLFVDINSNRM